MHLLFYGGAQVKLLHNHSVESVLKDLSVRDSRPVLYISVHIAKSYRWISRLVLFYAARLSNVVAQT